MHPREQVIRSMARTLIVESFASWSDENGEKAKPYMARGGQDWMDTTPAMTSECQEAALIEAAVLYGAIKQAWGAEPWILLQGYADGAEYEKYAKAWGHYAVMTCLGHGVAWEDSHTPLEDFSKSYTLLSRHNFDVPHIESLDWEWVDEAAKAQGLLQDISVLGLSMPTLNVLYRRLPYDLRTVGSEDVITIGDLLQIPSNTLLKLPDVGRVRLREVQKALEPYRR